MTEHDIDDVRTLFHDVQPAEVPVTRDLIGPAVAWGNARRRRDRIVVAATAGTLAVAALTALTLRPGSDHGSAPAPPLGTTQSFGAPTLAAPPPTGGAPAGAPTRWGPTTAPPASGATPTKPKTEAETKQAQQTWFRDLEALLPPGYHVTCDSSALNGVTGICGSLFDVSDPTGSSVTQFGVGAQPYLDPVPRGYSHEHTATSQIPLTSGVRQVPEGTVSVESLDYEARTIMSPTMLTDPSALVLHEAEYSFTAAGGGPTYHVQFTELVKHLPWAPGTGGDERKLFGYNPTGPALSPEQFAKIAADLRYPALMQQRSDLFGYVP